MGDHHIHCPRPRRPPPILRSVPSFEEAESATFDVSAALDKLFNPTPEEFNAALEKRFLPSKKTAAATPTCKFINGASSSRACIDDSERPVTVSSSKPNPANLQAFDDTFPSPTTTDEESDILPPLEDCVDDDDTERPLTVSPREPNPALQAFSLLHNNPAVQNVVASLVSDEKLWEAVMNNKKMMEYMESIEKANKNDANRSTNALEGEKIPTDSSDVNQSTTATGGEIIPTDSSPASSPISLTQAMKLRVLAIVRSLLELYQKIFKNPAAKEGSSSAAEESSSGNSIWKCTCISAPVMVLTITVIMVVLVKRE